MPNKILLVSLVALPLSLYPMETFVYRPLRYKKHINPHIDEIKPRENRSYSVSSSSSSQMSTPKLEINNERWIIKDRLSGKYKRFKVTKDYILKILKRLTNLEKMYPSTFTKLNEICTGGSPSLTKHDKSILRKYHIVRSNLTPHCFVQHLMNCVTNETFLAIKQDGIDKYVPIDGTIENISRIIRNLKKLSKRYPEAYSKLDSICRETSDLTHEIELAEILNTKATRQLRKKAIETTKYLKKYNTINEQNSPYSNIKKIVPLLSKDIHTPRLLNIDNLVDTGRIKKINNVPRINTRSLDGLIEAGYLRKVRPRSYNTLPRSFIIKFRNNNFRLLPRINKFNILETCLNTVK